MVPLPPRSLWMLINPLTRLCIMRLYVERTYSYFLSAVSSLTGSGKRSISVAVGVRRGAFNQSHTLQSITDKLHAHIHTLRCASFWKGNQRICQVPHVILPIGNHCNSACMLSRLLSSLHVFTPIKRVLRIFVQLLSSLAVVTHHSLLSETSPHQS